MYGHNLTMDVRALLLFLHLLGGAAWLGASLFANVVIVPYLARRPRSEWPDLVAQLVRGPERLVIAAALTAGVTGIVLGVSSGRFEGLDGLATAYGGLWVASIVVAVAVFATGGLVTSRAAARLAAATPGAAAADDLAAPDASPADEATLRRLRVGFAVELAGIVVILALMVGLGRS